MERVQRKRTPGWRKPENTKCVNRGTKFGNPFKVSDTLSAKEAVSMYKECILNNSCVYKYFEEPEATEIFNRFKWISENIEQLRGFNLSCFCKLSDPCHVDALFELLTIKN